MKKVLFALVALSLACLVACSSDDDKTENEVFLDNSVIQGMYQYKVGTDSVIQDFNKDNHLYDKTYDSYTKELRKSEDRGLFKITKTRVYFWKDYTEYMEYTLDNDTLIMGRSRYTRIKE